MKSEKIIFISVIVVIMASAVADISYGLVVDSTNVKQVYEESTIACIACHPEGSFGELNNYGKAYKEAGRSADAVKSIADVDSDADGVSNADEIKAGTNPGNPESK